MRDTPLEPGFPKPRGDSRPWNCRKEDAACTRKEPCVSCKGRRSRTSGLRKQREARKSLEKLTGTQAARFVGQLGNEEGWAGLPLRVEVKSGIAAQVVANKFELCERQSDNNRSIGDTRPFAAIHMPPGWGQDGILSFRLSTLPQELIDWLVAQ